MCRRLVTVTLVVPLCMTAQTIGYDLVKIPGVSLSPATSSVLATLNQAPSADLSALLPYSLVLQNSTPHTIVAYTLHLSFVDHAGQSSGHNRMYFNLESKSNGMEVGPAGIRLITPIDALQPSNNSAGVGQSSRETPVLLSRIAAQKTVTVSLDLLVFDTGQVFGKDGFQTLSYLQGYVSGGQQAASVVETGLSNGSSLSNIATQLRDLAGRMRNTADPGAMARAGQYERLARIAAAGSLGNLQSEVQSILAMHTWNFYR